jgi:HEAT repeat protein
MDQRHSSESTAHGAGASLDDALEKGLAEDLLRALSTAMRSHRLYGGESPMLERFLEALRSRLLALFEHVPVVHLHIDEEEIRWEGHVVYPSGGESGDLAFLFYKDGVRAITLLSGFEEEVEAFLSLLGKAPHLREEEDDLVTLLWQADFEGLRYEYVEPGHEGLDPPGRGGEAPQRVDMRDIRAAASEPSTSLSPDNFQETLYFLDESELRTVAEMVRSEAERDLLGDVLSALFDRMEDGNEERQIRIVQILNELLPSILSSGQFERSGALLEELVNLVRRGDTLSAPAMTEIRRVFDLLSRPETIHQLIETLEAQPGALQGDALGKLLGHFPPESLAPLMRAVEAVPRPDVKRALERAIDRLVDTNRDAVIGLLRDPDAGVAAGAARWAGRLSIGAAVNEVVSLLRHPEPRVRTAAITALQELRAAAAGRSLLPLLGDSDRGVRIAAARAIAALDFAPARTALEGFITGKELRAADRTEKLAFFEAYGRLAGGEGVALLDRALNGRSWLGRGETAETRACAALALARVRHPTARDSLMAAANDADPVVRTAVARALRGENS